MKDIIFNFLNRYYNTHLENDIDVIYCYSSNEFQYYDELINDFKTIFGVDEYLIHQCIDEWAIFDISEYIKIKRVSYGGNYSIAFGANSTATGNYSIIVDMGV